MNLRALWSGKLVLAACLAPVIAGLLWGGYALWRPSPAPPDPPATPEPVHPPIVALRERMLQQFHGNASNVFIEEEGFGYQRFRPMLKKIPYEIPYFSPTEIEVEEAPEPDADLAGLFKRSLDAFGRGAPPGEPDRGHALDKLRLPSVLGLYDRERQKAGRAPPGLQLRKLDLIGLLDRKNPKVYSGGPAFLLVPSRRDEKVTDTTKIVNSEEYGPYLDEGEPAPNPAVRSLDYFESAGIKELLKGEEVFVRHKDPVIRMLGALRAGDQCLQCHAGAKKGDLLGAFSYTFVHVVGPDLPDEDRK